MASMAFLAVLSTAAATTTKSQISSLQMDVHPGQGDRLPGPRAPSRAEHPSGAALSTGTGARRRRLVVWKEGRTTRLTQLVLSAAFACVRSRNWTEEFAAEQDAGLMEGAFGPALLPAVSRGAAKASVFASCQEC